HRGNIVGLARKSIRWHQHEQGRVMAATLRTLGPERPAALPPIALPVHPGIRFLATVKEICKEGAAMQHCIATYAGTAARGKCFLFHVEHAGRSASVAVDQEGTVREANGPRNEWNAAVQWGRRVLGRWGKALRPAVRQQEPDVELEDDGVPFWA